MRGRKAKVAKSATSKAAVKRQGASAAPVPKRVLNNLASALKSLQKAQSFLDGSTQKRKPGRPKKTDTVSAST